MTFPDEAPVANPVFYRTYSRKTKEGRRESWEEVCERTIYNEHGLAAIGRLTPEEARLVYTKQNELKAFTSGRWLWVGGTDWIGKPENYSGAFNCTSTNIVDIESFGLLMELAMMGCGTGAVLEPKYISQLPPVRNTLNILMEGSIGSVHWRERKEHTEVSVFGDTFTIWVGDSRKGWVDSYVAIIKLAMLQQSLTGKLNVVVNLDNVRPVGERLQGFGGIANPIKLPELYERCARILNRAVGRQLTSVECCLLVDEAAICIVAGNIRRCIAYGARVSAISGLKFIQDIQVGDLVLTSSGEYRPVVNKFIQGVQDVVEIRTPATSIRCTANHRVAVYDGLRSYIWKYAGQLQKGDRLISVPHNKGSDCASTDFAWLLGFYIGDGYANRRKTGQSEVVFTLSKSRIEGKLGEKCLRILRNLGYSPTVVCGSDKNWGAIKVYRKDLAEELLKYKQAWSVPVIPEIVWNGTPEIRAAFLAGLSDADGTPSRNVLVNSSKLEFLREVQKLALSLGIATTLHERKPKTLKDRERVYDGCHWIHIQGLQSQALAVALINQFAVRDGFTLKLAKKNGLSLPYQFAKELAATGWKPETICRANVLWNDPKGRPGYFRDANFDTLLAEDLVNPHWLPMEVQFVAPAGEAETFDIEVESDHEFIADGVLVHNSAGIRQFDSNDVEGSTAKQNLWKQDEGGNWRIDPERDSLRMANHTRVFHQKPSLEECLDAVRKQYYSGEGAIQWAGEAVARCSVDILSTPELKKEFLSLYHEDMAKAKAMLRSLSGNDEKELEHRMNRYALNPCAEVISSDLHCNLSEVHLNMLDPLDLKEQDEVFKAASLSVASLLQQDFLEPRYQYSRSIDPIVGVSFTGLFDFFVQAFGVDWLKWWEAGRPNNWEIRGKTTHYYLSDSFRQKEEEYLNRWKNIVHQTVWDYCDRHSLKRPNRCTLTQPAGTKSLLTGASPGWHPPKAQRFIRRVTFAKNDPVALACMDYGYSVIPSQSDKDEDGNLLNDPFDPRTAEWLVEFPVAVPWADLPGADTIEISQFSAVAQFDFYMQVQKYYTTYNTSATIELREAEVEPLATKIYKAIDNDEGYISAALLARFDDHQSFPRLPFEPIDKATYERLVSEVGSRRKAEFHDALAKYDTFVNQPQPEFGPAACDSDKCLFPTAP